MKPDTFFNLVTQDTVKHQIFSEDCKLNAAWDIAISPEGRVFYSLCAELGVTSYVEVYEYKREDNSATLLFKLDDVVLQQDDAIRPSKVHTSMAFLNDGRLIMCTHTTAQSPKHPYWLPAPFYHHQFEGFQGSNLLIYDYKNNVLENRGVPVPFESVYGGAYDKKHNAYYISGMMCGHFYRYDVAANKVLDMGRATEEAVYCLRVGPDGHIYTSTRTGRMIRINVDTVQIEDLGIDLPYHATSNHMGRHQINHAVWHPNGKMYFGIFNHPALMAYDPKTNSVEEVCTAATEYAEHPELNLPQGIAVDEQGFIWQGVCTRKMGGMECGLRLYRFDPKTGEHLSYGYLGSKQRTLLIISEMEIHNGVLYALDSNHGEFDPAGILSVELASLKPQNSGHDFVPGTDPRIYMQYPNGRELFPYDKSIYDAEVKKLDDLNEMFKDRGKIIQENDDRFQFIHASTHKLWKRVGAENSQVQQLVWKDNQTLCGVCGNGPYYQFVIQNHTMVTLEPLSHYEKVAEDLSAYAKLPLPEVPGRHFRAVPTAAVALEDGTALVGTQDGMLAWVKGEAVFSLGSAAAYGPVQAMATNKDKTVVYGVAAYPKALGSVFSFNKQEGLRWRGRLSLYADRGDGFADCTQPSCVALSPDGRFVAFGCEDRLGVVFVCQVKE